MDFLKKTLSPLLTPAPPKAAYWDETRWSQIRQVVEGATLDQVLERIRAGRGPIVAGPWLSEVGFEVLYWIPFLNWIVRTCGIDRKRIIVVSRGGAEPWYRHLGGRYVEIFDSFTEAEFRSKNQERREEGGTQKQNTLSPFDEEIMGGMGRECGLQDFEWVHPLLMYRLFEEFWAKNLSTKVVSRHTQYERMRVDGLEEYRKDLPKDYVAVKFYFSKCFPDVAPNRKFITSVLRSLTRQGPVVMLNTGLTIDDHGEFLSRKVDGLLRVDGLMTPRNNLAVQTAVIQGARAFYGTYGGFSYLAPFMGVPSVAFYSLEYKFLQVHLDIAYRACRVLKYGTFDGLKPRPEHDATPKAEFTALNVDNLEAIRLLFGGDR